METAPVLNETPSAAEPSPWRARIAPVLALGAVAVVLLLLRPAAPFEWDEVLHQRALDTYDVAMHSPHPPGVPAYIGAGKALYALTGDPQLALQLTSVLGALAGMLLVFLVGRRLGASSREAMAASVALLVIPGFLFHANIGMSDVPATAVALAAALACLAAVRRPAWLPLASGIVALSLGVRPQVVLAVVPFGIAALVVAGRRRAWGTIGLSAAVGVVVSLAVWVPAVLVTGVERYRHAIELHTRYVAEVEPGLRLPAVSLRDAAVNWLVVPFGDAVLAAVFWVLVGVGAVAWWVGGRRWLAAACAVTGAGYLLGAMFSMNMLLSARYCLPAMPYLALLAAGVLVLPHRALRLAGTTLLGLWVVASVVWVAPAYRLRTQTAPVWAALSWVKGNFDPARTTVVFDGHFSPHAQYVLGRAGFKMTMSDPSRLYTASERPDGDVVLVTTKPVPGTDVLFSKAWESRRIGKMTYRRYQSCAVARAPSGPGPLYSPAWQVQQAGWSVWGTGQVRVEPSPTPRLLRLCAITKPVSLGRNDAPVGLAQPGECRDVALLPNLATTVQVTAPGSIHALMKPVEVLAASANLDAFPLADDRGPAAAWVVPVVARIKGEDGAFWQTDARVISREPHELELLVVLLSTGSDNRLAPAWRVPVGPGATVEVEDLLAREELALFSTARTGAAILIPRGAAGPLQALPRFEISARTYDARRDPFGRGDDRVPVVLAAAGLGPGEEASIGRAPAGARVAVGAVSLSDASAEVVFELGIGRDPVKLSLAPFGHFQKALPKGRSAVVSARVSRAGRDARVIPYLAVVEPESGRVTYHVGTSAVSAGVAPMPRLLLAAPPVAAVASQ